MLRIAALATIVLLSSGSAMAAPAPAQTVPHSVLNGPCAADSAKYCARVKFGGGRIISCMEHHVTQLTSQCRTVIEQGTEMRGGPQSPKTPSGVNAKAKPASSKPHS